MKLQTKSHVFDLNERTHIMGILNITPDSFSDGGQYISTEKAVEQAVHLEKSGADIIDIGGESTRPEHEVVSAEEELERVIPIIKAVRQNVGTPISIDTYKAETAKRAVEAGAQMINDIWGTQKDPDMASIAAKLDVPIVLMHNRTNKSYISLIDDIKQDLTESVTNALSAGVKKANIILDPGVGFGKTMEDNFVVMNHLEAFHEWGLPILLGASRKSFITEVLPSLSPEQRDHATGATTCLGITKGVQLVRVHDVALTKELALMMDKMLGKK